MVHGGNIQFNFAKLSTQEVKQRVFHVIRSLVDFGTHHGCVWQQWWPAMPRFWHLMGRANRPVMPPLLAKSRTPLRETRRTKERIYPELFQDRQFGSSFRELQLEDVGAMKRRHSCGPSAHIKTSWVVPIFLRCPDPP